MKTLIELEKKINSELTTKIDKSNKETIARMKMVDDAIDDAAEGFVMGDNKYNAELVAENLAQRRGLVYDDLSTRERAKIYGEAFDALSKKFRDDLAIGGRVGLKDGMSRRKFLQMLGGLAALPVVGKFFKGAKIASKAAPVIEKTTSSPPSYFFDLVNKILNFPNLLEGFTNERSPHSLVHYIKDLSASFHTFYEMSPVIGENEPIENTRLLLTTATQTIEDLKLQIETNRRAKARTQFDDNEEMRRTIDKVK